MNLKYLREDIGHVRKIHFSLLLICAAAGYVLLEGEPAKSPHNETSLLSVSVARQHLPLVLPIVVTSLDFYLVAHLLDLLRRTRKRPCQGATLHVADISPWIGSMGHLVPSVLAWLSVAAVPTAVMGFALSKLGGWHAAASGALASYQLAFGTWIVWLGQSLSLLPVEWSAPEAPRSKGRERRKRRRKEREL